MRKKWIKALLVLIIQVLFWQIVFHSKTLSSFWFNKITLNYNSLIYSITSSFRVPIGEFFYAIFFISILYTVINNLRNNKISKIINHISLIYFIYNALWGITYYKQTFNNKSTEIVIDNKELKDLYYSHLQKAIYYRHTINKTNKPVTFKLNTNNYVKDFKKQETKLLNEDWIYNYKLINNPIVKFSNISKLMNYTGVLGYYNPFSIESNINRFDTDLKLPFTVYHELAHQMGFASENQANFIAYYIGIHSSYNEVKYATYYKTIFSLLGAISKSDPSFSLKEIENLPKGIINDLNAEINYYSQFDGKANNAFSAINDQFLKANNQDGKVSYSKYIELIYYYHQKTKGT